MKLTVHHKTTYRYSRPVVLQPHRIMLRPRGSHDIVVLASSLSCSPKAELDWTQDVFGNLIATATFSHPTAGLEIINVLTVQQSAAEWPVCRIGDTTSPQRSMGAALNYGVPDDIFCTN